jgi:hypothetical protein
MRARTIFFYVVENSFVNPYLEPQVYGTFGFFLWIQIQESDSYSAKNTFMNNNNIMQWWHRNLKMLCFTSFILLASENLAL